MCPIADIACFFLPPSDKFAAGRIRSRDPGDGALTMELNSDVRKHE